MKLIFRVGKHSYHGLRVAIGTWLYPALDWKLKQPLKEAEDRVKIVHERLDAIQTILDEAALDSRGAWIREMVLSRSKAKQDEYWHNRKGPKE